MFRNLPLLASSYRACNPAAVEDPGGDSYSYEGVCDGKQVLSGELWVPSGLPMSERFFLLKQEKLCDTQCCRFNANVH